MNNPINKLNQALEIITDYENMCPVSEQVSFITIEDISIVRKLISNAIQDIIKEGDKSNENNKGKP